MDSGPSSVTSQVGSYVRPISSPICKKTGEWFGPLGLEGPSHLWHFEHLWAQGPAGQCLSGSTSPMLLP